MSGPIDYDYPGCWFEECTRLLALPGKSGRLTCIGRLDPPLELSEDDETTSRETYCLCIRNKNGLRRLFLNGRDDGKFLRRFLDVMEQDEEARAQTQ